MSCLAELSNSGGQITEQALESGILLEAFGNLFESPSSHVLVEASAALEVFAPHHKVAICHAKLLPNVPGFHPVRKDAHKNIDRA